MNTFKQLLLLEMAFGLQGTQITKDEVVGIIASSKKEGWRPFAFTSVTNARLKKKGNPYGEVYKVTQAVFGINRDYTSAVNKRRGKEGLEQNFQSQGYAWKGEEKDGPVVTLNGKTYVQLMPNEQTKPTVFYVYEDSPGHFSELDKEEVRRIQGPPKEYVPPAQGTSVEVMVRRYDLDNIYGFTFDNKEYVIAENVLRLSPMLIPVWHKLKGKD